MVGSSGMGIDSAIDAANYLESAFLDAYTADSVTVPAIGADVTVTNVNAGERWDIDSEWFGGHPDDAANYNFEGLVKAVNGTSVIITCARATGAGGTKSGWSFARSAPPKTTVPFNSKNGLNINVAVGGDEANDITITKGRMRDSTNTMDLVLTSSITKQLDAVWAAGTNAGAVLQSANLAGTIAQSASTAIVGTSTLFQTYFAAASGQNKNSDWDARAEESTYPDGFRYGNITRSGSATPIQVVSVSSNTAAVSGASTTYSGNTFKRGMIIPGSGLTGTQALVLMRSDADGSCDVGVCSLTKDGLPDLPSGYTYYGTLGLVYCNTSGIQVLKEAMKGDRDWTTMTKAATSGNTIDFPIPVRAQEILVEFQNISFAGSSRALMCQTLLTAGNPDTTAANYFGYSTDATTGANVANTSANMIGAPFVQAAAGTATGSLRITGWRDGIAAQTVASLNSSTAGASAIYQGHYTIAGVALYGLRFLSSGAASAFDGSGSISVSYR